VRPTCAKMLVLQLAKRNSYLAEGVAMHDPKYRFGPEDTVLHRDGGYFLPDDEPLVLFRGKDVGALVALNAYREFMEYVSQHADTAHAREIARAHATSIAERISAISTFQSDNPDRTGLGCHTCPPGVGPYDIAEHLSAPLPSVPLNE
jgi:hypothetical protein